MNVRRLYNNLTIRQECSSQFVDLTPYFSVGPITLPSFGCSTEIIIPWDEDKPSSLILNISRSQVKAVINPCMFA